MAFTFRVLPGSNDYFRAELTATRGPLSTRNYRIGLEAVALPGNQTFLHLSYTYESGLAGRIAMSAYLATGGRGKVGFSNTGLTHDGRPIYVDGVLGLVERNTMRYYLAIDSFMQARQAPASAQLDQRLNAWFTGVENYPLQLHEMHLQAYLEMKHAEVLRQQTVQ
jgi:hypothetical protein